MRNVIVLSGDLYVRNFVKAGAFRQILGDSTAILASDRMARLSEVMDLPGYAGSIHDPASRTQAYARMRLKLIASYRRRSRTMQIKLDQLPLRHRTLVKGLALPGIRQAALARDLRRLGLNEHLQARLAELRPEVIIAPVSGYSSDTLALDACRGARAVGAKTLFLVAGWDNLSAKSHFAVLPHRMGVWGEQSVDHAVRIHRMPRQRVSEIGAPTFDMYHEFDPRQSVSPHSKPYVLFAGTAPPFDELDALHRLDKLFTRIAPQLTIVYRPHPWREPRRSPDRFSEDDFDNVVLDRQIKADYGASQRSSSVPQPAQALPELDYYPSLVGNAEFVISPLSTMLIEAGLLERRVLVLAYSDGIHPVSLDTYAQYDHLDGVANVTGFATARSRDDLLTHAAEMVAEPKSEKSIREQMRQWLYFDERTYADRLAEVVEATRMS